jgi:hypothetical protein
LACILVTRKQHVLSWFPMIDAQQDATPKDKKHVLSFLYVYF